MNRMFSLRRDDERDTPADGPAQRRGDYPNNPFIRFTASAFFSITTADEIETTLTVCYDLTTRINKAGNGASSKEAEVYDLAGRKVEKPVQKGV